jgi:ubiquinone/menaquinone biosynthesis C-methylase UbiE
MKKDSSWGKVADWYDGMLADNDSYQAKVIAPNLLRIMAISAGERVLDVACGQGFFSRQFFEAGAVIDGCDISSELIGIAKQTTVSVELTKRLNFAVAPADKLPYKNAEFDTATIVLALQNIENLQGTIAECARVLKKGGRLFIVLNHPAFRIPKHSSWGFDDSASLQYRRLDAYMSESSEKILMNPGKSPAENNSKYTFSFHRPLQVYFKAFSKAGFAVTRLEEWTSHKKSEKGKRSMAEDTARKEFPMFLCIEAAKFS